MMFGSALLVRTALKAASLALLCSATLVTFAPAQATPGGTMGPSLSKFEGYIGYGFYKPFSSSLSGHFYETSNLGAVVSASEYFSRHYGLQVEGNFFPAGSGDNDCIYSLQAGPVARFQRGRLVPFVHALGGFSKLGGPALQTCGKWGYGVTGGGGLDVILAPYHDRFALRPIQMDIAYSRIDNGAVSPTGERGGIGEIKAIRFSAGLTFRFSEQVNRGGGDATFVCSTEPSEAYAGDPMQVIASTRDLKANKKTSFLWTSSGGRISGSDGIATIDTAGLKPGLYNVSSRLTQGSNGRQVASCSTVFSIHGSPPTLSCSADQTSVRTGEQVLITSTAQSSVGRPLTYSYSSNAGQISGTGPTAVLSTAGVTTGSVTVTCSAMDDKGESGTATTNVIILAPAVPLPAAPGAVTPLAAASRTLCTLTFADPAKGNDLDAAGLSCLDGVASTLNREATARLVLVGNHPPGEPPADAAQRAEKARTYLVTRMGIDPARLDVRVVENASKSVTTILLPAGVSFDPYSVRP